MLLYVDVGQWTRTTYWMLEKDTRDIDKKHTLFTESTWDLRTEYPLIDMNKMIPRGDCLNPDRMDLSSAKYGPYRLTR